MNYAVVILRRAELDLNRNALWWAEHRDADEALRWLDEFTEAIQSLAEHPERHALAREDRLFEFPLRELHFGLGSRPTHRALFTIRGEKVLVYTIRHAAQADVTQDDLI